MEGVSWRVLAPSNGAVGKLTQRNIPVPVIETISLSARMVPGTVMMRASVNKIADTVISFFISLPLQLVRTRRV